MKINDLVRIVYQPSNQHTFLIGQVGIVDEIDGDNISITAIRLDGNINGCGTIPVSCLKLENSPEWLAAKLKREELFDRYSESIKQFQNSCNAKKEELAIKYNLSIEDIQDIFDSMIKVHNEYID